jgi:alkyl hydroperoxide reductase subunit D
MDLDQVFEKFETVTQRDLKLNFKKFFLESSLSPKDVGLITLAAAETVNCLPLINLAVDHLKKNGATEEEISESRDAAAIMSLNNMFYRFRHFTHGKEAYQKPAGLRMNVLGRPVTGKASFEMMALAVSIINGCEMCVNSHEKSVLEHGITEDQVYDLARLTSVVRGLDVSFRQLNR